MIALPEQQRKWWSLGALVFSLAMVMLDDTVVVVALPSIQRDLGVGLSALEWIINAYVVTFAALMLTGGKLADLLGRRRIFLLGLATFTAASLASGLAPSGELLIGARVVQGVGAALMVPAMLAIISASFPPKERGLALGVWMGVSGLALAVGPLVGGLITERIDWSWIFFINVPIGVLGFAAGLLLVAESKDTSRRQGLDLPGLLTSALALFALTFALIEGQRYGWTSLTILGSFVASAVCLLVFITIERRTALPMLDLSLFRSRTFAGVNVVNLLSALGMFGVLFFLSLYLQQVLGYSAVRAGAALLPMMAMLIVISPVAGKLSDRVGPRWFMTAGPLLLAGGLFMLSRLEPASSFWGVLPGLLIAGAGEALALAPMYAAALGSAPVAKAGVASAVLSAFNQVGGALGIAVLGAIVTAKVSSGLAHGLAPSVAFTQGFSGAFVLAAVIALGGAAVAALVVRKPQHEEGHLPSDVQKLVGEAAATDAAVS